MKKVLISLLMICSTALLNANWFGQCNSIFSSDGTITVNGATYHCNGSSTVINGTVWCNGVQISPNQGGKELIQDSGTLETKHFPISGIRNISATTMGNLLIEQCKNPENCIENLSITADKNILSLLQHEVSGDTLTLKTKNNASFSTKTPINYHVIVKSLNNLSKSGSVNITASPIVTDVLNVETSGSGNITMEKVTAKKLRIDGSGNSNINAHIETNELHLNISGSNNITLQGKTKQQNISLSGAQEYNAKNLESDYVSLNVSGCVNVHVNAKEKIQGHLSGASSGTYNKKHNPTVDVKTYGASRFKNSSW